MMLKGCPGSEKTLNCSTTHSPLIFRRLKRTSYWRSYWRHAGARGGRMHRCCQC